MNKSISITCEDFKQGLADLINNSNLPAVVIESILQNYLNEVSNIAKKQYQSDKIQYEKFLLEKNKDMNVKED